MVTKIYFSICFNDKQKYNISEINVFINNCLINLFINLKYPDPNEAKK